MKADELRPGAQCLIGVFLLFFSDVVAAAAGWTRFRGPDGSGVSDTRGFPGTFGPGTNLLWRAKVPAGNSSPVVANGRVILAGYEGSRRTLSCLDGNSGARLWENSIEATRVERKTEPNDPASSTPVTDGRNVYVLFSGFGLISYSMDGGERWRTPLEPFNQPRGMSSSPILAEDLIVVLADQVTDSHIAACETSTGK